MACLDLRHRKSSRHLLNDFWTLSEPSECMKSLVHRSENIHLPHPTKHTDTRSVRTDSCKSTELYKHTWLFNLSAYGFLTVRLFSVKNSSSLIQHEKWAIYFLSVTFPRLPQTALDFHLCMEPKTAITATGSGSAACTSLKKRCVPWASVGKDLWLELLPGVCSIAAMCSLRLKAVEMKKQVPSHKQL